MDFKFTEKQIELLKETFGYYVDGGVGNRIDTVNDYWKVIEGISIMMELSPTDASLVLDEKYGLGDNSLTRKIKEKEGLV